VRQNSGANLVQPIQPPPTTRSSGPPANGAGGYPRPLNVDDGATFILGSLVALFLLVLGRVPEAVRESAARPIAA
jgi:hypothetical protein